MGFPAAHADSDFTLNEQAGVIAQGILNAAIRMMDQNTRLPSAIIEPILSAFVANPAYTVLPSRIGIQYHGRETQSLPQTDIGDVGYP